MTILKIDIDLKPPEWWLTWWEVIAKIIVECSGMTLKRISRHETEKGWHFFIEIHEELSAEKTNFMQFLLGDDRTRVKINAWRIERGIPRWNKLFDRKLWRKEQKTITCWYCGNKIPLIKVED